MTLSTIPVRSGSVQIDENVSRLRSFIGTDHAAVFQLIHDARGAGIAEPEAALEQGYARLLLAANDLDALLDE